MGRAVLHIKNMVCNRCIKVLVGEFEKLGLEIEQIELGRVRFASPLENGKMVAVKAMLDENGFELIDDKKSQLIDRIKTLIIERIHYSEEAPWAENGSGFIASELHYDYSYLSKLFSSVEGITIEKYIINQKIEKAKELLAYNELSIKEISYRLGYSSAQHFSNQFKKVTGLTPSHFKNLKAYKRKPLDEV